MRSSIPLILLALLGCTTGATQKAEVTPTSAEVRALISTIRPGARDAVLRAFDTLTLLDGGDAEDVMRALANLATADPRLLMDALRTKKWPPERIKTLVRMLPLETVDQPAVRLQVVRERLAAIEQVRQAKLADVRAAALAALTEYEAELNHE